MEERTADVLIGSEQSATRTGATQRTLCVQLVEGRTAKTHDITMTALSSPVSRLHQVLLPLPLNQRQLLPLAHMQVRVTSQQDVSQGRNQVKGPVVNRPTN